MPKTPPHVDIVVQGPESFAAHGEIPIAFVVKSRLDLSALVASLGAESVEVPCEPWRKDYDSIPEERPSALSDRFDTTHWVLVAAYLGGDRVGGAVVAWNTPGFDMLEGRDDLAVIVDLRVVPSLRGRGLGRALFQAVREWASSQGCSEVRVETQDTNVSACAFYRSMGCQLHSADPHGYGPSCDEAKLVWTCPL